MSAERVLLLNLIIRDYAFGTGGGYNSAMQSWGKWIRTLLGLLSAAYGVLSLIEAPEIMSRWMEILRPYLTNQAVIAWLFVALGMVLIGYVHFQDRWRAAVSVSERQRFRHLNNAVECLSRAYDYGNEPGADRFQFWVSLGELEKLGTSRTDLLYLARRGFIEFGNCWTVAGIDGVGVQKTGHFSDTTRLGLTEAGRKWASEEFGLAHRQVTNSA